MVMQAFGLGVAGNEASKKITGSSETSVGRTAVATGAGAALGAAAAGTLAVVGVAAAAPIAIPLAIASGFVAGIASLFD